jgi:hypothetical protein
MYLIRDSGLQATSLVKRAFSIVKCPLATVMALDIHPKPQFQFPLYISHKCSSVQLCNVMQMPFLPNNSLHRGYAYMGYFQFSRYITTSSTNITPSTPGSDLEPPLAPPPPPPPLNIPPSRARRQLAARLALHSRQNAESSLSSNGGELPSDKSGQQKVVNPFATEEDDEHEDFTISNLEFKTRGKGHFPSRAVLAGKPVVLDDLDIELYEGEAPKNHVGNTSKSSTGARAHFPLVWPFGQIQRPNYDCETSLSNRQNEKEREKLKLSSIFGGHIDLSFRNYNKGASRNSANNDGTQSSDESASDDDDSDDEFGTSAGIAGAKSKVRRRLRRLSTTEATRRTSIEDDDDEGEVVHVTRGNAVGDDEDLIEI